MHVIEVLANTLLASLDTAPGIEHTLLSLAARSVLLEKSLLTRLVQDRVRERGCSALAVRDASVVALLY